MTFLGVWFPITVRKAQKLARKKNDRFLDWGRLCLALDLPSSERQALIHKLDQLAQTRGPGFLIEGPKPVNPSDQSDSSKKSNLSNKEDEKGAGANPPSAAPEEGGTENPGPEEGGKGGDPEEGDSAQTDSQKEESQSQPEISADPGRGTPGEGETPGPKEGGAGDTPKPSRPETGNSTSGGWSHGAAPSSPLRTDEPLSTALGGEDVSRRSEGLFHQEDCPRDGVFFQWLPGEEQPEESPPQKKWGNQAEGKPSDESLDKPGGITAKIGKLGVDRSLVRQVRQRLSRLVGDSSEDFGPRRDLSDLCVRLKTFQKLPPARREERGRPAILVLADVSKSCSRFAWEAVAVAKAAGAVGVPGADVVSVTHSNGRPFEVLHNQFFILPESIGPLPAKRPYVFEPWYSALQKRFSFQVVIALGDWHALSVYVHFLLDPEVQKLIWINGDRTARGFGKDESAKVIEAISEIFPGLTPKMPRVRQKLSYFDGCGGVEDFISLIQ